MNAWKHLFFIINHSGNVIYIKGFDLSRGEEVGQGGFAI